MGPPIADDWFGRCNSLALIAPYVAELTPRVASPVSPGEWKLLLTEIPEGSSFGYKFLRDDVDWQVGDDAVGVGGQDHVIAPAF